MHCPFCQYEKSKVVDTTKNAPGGIRRRRECLQCGERYSTLERAILATPLLVKQDGTREEFDREKLTQGIRTACTKRPIPAAAIERLVGEIESTLQRMGKAEVSSRVVGDMAMSGLKDLDHVAYIRYASVYLQFKDLQAIRTEIDQLLSEES
jgi:transcriptional repressor NrdR